MSGFEFRLLPHPHKQVVHGVRVQVITDVQQVQVRDGDRWERCGYCGAEPGRPITLCRYYPEVFRIAVRAFVEKSIGEVSALGMPPQPQLEERCDDDDE